MPNVLEWERRKWWVWLYVWLYFALACVLLGIAMTAQNYTYTKQYGNPPGQVTSQQWSYDFFVTFFLILLLYVPVSLAYAVDRPQDESRFAAFMLGSGVLVVWNLVTWIYGVVQWAHADGTDPSNFFNKYNDPLNYCPLYYKLSGIPCAYPLMNYNPIPSVNALAPSWMASMQLWVTFFFIFFVLFGMVLTACWVRPMMLEYVEMLGAATATTAAGGGSDEPLVESRIPIQQQQQQARVVPGESFRGRRRQ